MKLRLIVYIFTILNIINYLIATAQKQTIAENIFKLANLSVVKIETDKASGSGCIVDKKGIIVTNYHVVENADTIIIKLSDGTFLKADYLKGYDPSLDIAVIQMKIASDIRLNFLKIGNCDKLKEGEEVFTVGTSLGEFFNTIANGIISGFRINENGRKDIQFTAPISPGNSGGALLDKKGDLIGITTKYSPSGQNLNFGIPISYALGFINSKDTIPLNVLSIDNVEIEPQPPKIVKSILGNHDFDYFYFASVPFTEEDSIRTFVFNNIKDSVDSYKIFLFYNDSINCKTVSTEKIEDYNNYNFGNDLFEKIFIGTFIKQSISPVGSWYSNIAFNIYWDNRRELFQALQELKKSPEDIELNLKAADLYNKLGLYESAIRFLNHAIDFDKKDYRAWLKKGIFYYSIRSDFNAALEFLSKADILNPSNITTKKYLSLVYKELNEKTKSTKLYNDILKIDPTSSWALGSIGIDLLEKDSLNEAVEYLKKSFTLHPNSKFAITVGKHLGDAYRDLGKYSDATKILRYLADSRYRNFEIVSNYIRSAILDGSEGEIEKYYDIIRSIDQVKALEEKINNSLYLASGSIGRAIYFGQERYAQKRYSTSIRYFQEAAKESSLSELIPTYIGIAACNIGLGNDHTAIKYLDWVLDLKGKLSEFKSGYSQYFNKSAENYISQKTIQNLANKYKNSPGLQICVLFSNMINDNKLNINYDYLVRAEALKSKNSLLMKIRAGIFPDKNLDKSVKDLKSLQKDDFNDETLEHLARLLYMKYLISREGSNIDEAISILQKLSYRNPTNNNYIGTLGLYYYRKGDFQKSLDYSEIALKTDPTSIWIRINRAQAFLFLDKISDAEIEYAFISKSGDEYDIKSAKDELKNIIKKDLHVDEIKQILSKYFNEKI